MSIDKQALIQWLDENYWSERADCERDRASVYYHVKHEVEAGTFDQADEIAALRQENEKLQRIADERLSWIENVGWPAKEERKKLIEGLREIEDESSHEDACITKINGIARDLLEEIGVTEDEYE